MQLMLMVRSLRNLYDDYFRNELMDVEERQVGLHVHLLHWLRQLLQVHDTAQRAISGVATKRGMALALVILRWQVPCFIGCLESEDCSSTGATRPVRDTTCKQRCESGC